MPLALLTGATSKTGRAIATALGAYDLLLHAHRSDAEKMAMELGREDRKIWTVYADFSEEAGAEKVVEAVRNLGTPLDALIHNASVFEAQRFGEISRADYRRIMAINVETPFFLSQALLPQLRKSPRPTIVNLVDLEGALSGYPTYSISKAALTMMTRQLAVELGPQIRVNGVAPGIIGEMEGFSEETRKIVRGRIPAGRFGTPEELAEVVRFLVEGPSFVNGQVWAVDGGRSARR